MLWVTSFAKSCPVISSPRGLDLVSAYYMALLLSTEEAKRLKKKRDGLGIQSRPCDSGILGDTAT